MTVRIVLDTSVWLNLAGDYRNLPLLNQMHAMAREGELDFIVPDIVLEEFERNRERVLKASKASQKDQFKRVRSMLKQFGKGDIDPVLDKIIDVENKLHMHAGAVDETMATVQSLMSRGTQVVPSMLARSRAATRGLDMAAPFHKGKNSIADAVILETYNEIVDDSAHNDDRFAFITANTNDFTDPTVDNRLPHPDIALYFDGKKSTFSIDVSGYLRNLMIDLDPNGIITEYYVPEEPRVSSEIWEAVERFRDQVWYNRHRGYMDLIDAEVIEVVDEMPKDKPYDQKKVTKANLATFRAAGERVEKKYADEPEALGPFDDFEWGMINGKLSALRWVMGEEWDFLDT